ncbi:MAG: DEAD/DEAH box helicase, partial [Candidatus Lokiarchaeota archaeon]|nr:DEAD/DEAH box helicase [Candidatus Lokiarchaeota archaeon]
MTILNYINENESNKEELRNYINENHIFEVLIKNNVYNLRDIQKEAIEKGLFFKKNFLVCAPSGSGKTIIGELAIANNYFTNSGKGVYLVPYKAIAAEKFKYFKKNYAKYGLNVVLSIGDSEIDEKEIINADIVITTFEKLDSLIRNFKLKNNWLHLITTIVIDEIHILGDEYRGFKL